MRDRQSWSYEEDAMLRACAQDGLSGSETARVLSRSVGAVYGRAARVKVRFTSADHASPRAFIAKGGVLIREEVGGAIGIVWGRAHRSGPGFAPGICERYLQLGLLQAVAGSGQLYALVPGGAA